MTGLVEKYLSNQGVVKDFREIPSPDLGDVLVAYTEEGAVPEFYYCSRTEAEEIIDRWSKTGTFYSKKVNPFSLEINVIEKQPHIVQILTLEKTYVVDRYT